MCESFTGCIQIIIIIIGSVKHCLQGELGGEVL